MHKLIGLKFLMGLGLLAGAGMVLTRMAEMRHEMLAEGPGGPQVEGEHRRHLGHGHWRKRVPPMFEYWHRQAHAQEQAGSDVKTPAPDKQAAPETDKA